MSDQSQKSRFAIDLDDLERQLRSSPAQDVKQPVADPFAELARLVGQDDPYRDMNRDMFKPTLDALKRIEPSFASKEQLATSQPQPDYSAPQDDLSGALDEFDAIFDRQSQHANAAHQASSALSDAASPESQVFRYSPGVAPHASASQDLPVNDHLASFDNMISRDLDQILQENRPGEAVYQQQRTQEMGYAPYQSAAVASAGVAMASSASVSSPKHQTQPLSEEELYAANDVPAQTRRFGKGALTAAVLVAVGLGGVGAAALWRGGNTSGGEPPMIKADAGPSKVQPQNPGGADIPDQNKQIYERSTTPKPGDTKIVNREEQPVDVQAAARSSARVVQPGPGAGATNPPGADAASSSQSASIGSIAALGEPRKVRTILIRPDGTIAGTGAAASTQIAAAPTTGTPQTTSPSSASASPASSALVRQQAPKPEVAPRPAPQLLAATPESSSAPLAITPALRAATPIATTPAPQRLAAAPAADPASAPASGSGNFVVQLGAPGSEEEARSTFASLQRRYPDELGGQRAIVRKAEVGGREIYRLRVGNFTNSEAADLCNRLKARGGQCFIARN